MVEFLKEVISSDFGQAVILLAVSVIVQRVATAKGKLVWELSHQHHYQMPRFDEDGSFPVLTQQIWFQNTGRAALEGVEVVLNWKPQHLEIWDPRGYETRELPDGRYSLTFPNLAGRKFFTLSMIDTVRELPIVVNTRSSQGTGKRIPMGPQRIFPRWVLFLTGSSMVLGAATAAFLLLRVLSLAF